VSGCYRSNTVLRAGLEVRALAVDTRVALQKLRGRDTVRLSELITVVTYRVRQPMH
jgi:hypothetical protein